jgi:hypothetical protein
MSLALWLLVYLVLTYAVGKLFEVVVGWKTVGLVFYPGMLIAAGGRLLASVIAQQKGKQDVMRSGGPSDSEPPAGSAVFRFLWSIGPFVTCITAFILLFGVVLETDFDVPSLPTIEARAEAVGDAAESIGEQLNAMIGKIKRMRVGDWRLWAMLYAGFALIVAAAPGRHDLVSVAGFCVALGGGAFLLDQLGIRLVAKGLYSGTFWEALSFLVGMGALVLVASTVILLPIKFLGSKKDD